MKFLKKKWKSAMDVCCEEPEDDISDCFRELTRILMNENDLRMPTNRHEA